jgi:hypothetical protein
MNVRDAFLMLLCIVALIAVEYARICVNRGC